MNHDNTSDTEKNQDSGASTSHLATGAKRSHHRSWVRRQRQRDRGWIAYLHQSMVALGHPYDLDVTLVDGDLVSRTNCVRQPFSESEIGLYKAIVLANRINLFWGLNWKSVPHFLDETWREETDILIGCVDSRDARNKITQSAAYGRCYYVLDIGNNYDTGQFILGQPKNSRNNEHRLRLPTVAELFPEIINPKLDEKDNLPSCSAVQALEKQAAFINQTLAYQALAMLARLFRDGCLSHHGCFLSLSQGRMTPLPVKLHVQKKRSRSTTMRQSPLCLANRFIITPGSHL